jgi:hypothetical protein
MVGVDENNMYACTWAFVHTRAWTRKGGSREGKKEGRKEKEERKEQRDAPKLSHADGHVQAKRACCASVSLPPLGRKFSCCKQERRRRKGGIARQMLRCEKVLALSVRAVGRRCDDEDRRKM